LELYYGARTYEYKKIAGQCLAEVSRVEFKGNMWNGLWVTWQSPDTTLRKRRHQYKSISEVQNVFYIEFRSGLWNGTRYRMENSNNGFM